MFTLVATTFNGPLNHLYQGQFLVLLRLYQYIQTGLPKVSYLAVIFFWCLLQSLQQLAQLRKNVESFKCKLSGKSQFCLRQLKEKPKNKYDIFGGTDCTSCCSVPFSFSQFIVLPLPFVVTQISAFKRLNLAPAWTSVHSLFHSMYDFQRLMFFSSCIHMQLWYFFTIIVLTSGEKKYQLLGELIKENL